ncbi:phage tail protein [Hafnia alvei]|uniref:phage tail protein n=1 Tax=Hafnia alvei TaxID=569 RepID=UPI000E05FC63|nr:phage tail protein [Hafnia alvei]STQ72060.1 Phage-related protein [Hafnia alvei]
METFHFSPRPGMGVSTKPNVTTVNFGDGYEQRRAAGINALLESYTPTFRVAPEELPAIESFFRRHGAVRAFYWRSPHRHVRLKIVCREWSHVVNNRYIDVSCKFDEVVA